MGQITENYISKGLVQFGYINYPFLGDESFAAAEAAECAGDQGEDSFWAYHDRLYERQFGENQGTFDDASLKKFAADLGLDTAAFNQCLDSGKFTDLVKREKEESQKLGVKVTPTFIINGKTVIGGQDYQTYAQIIEAILAEKK